MSTQNRIPGLSFLLIISFIEGGVVMVTEIAGAKLLTPYFGASLYSWAATLSITLLALMTGYYTGGYISSKPSLRTPLHVIYVFMLSGLAVLLMPSLAKWVMQRTVTLSFFTGLILSEFSFIFFPILLMGIVSPMIVSQLTQKAENAGKSTGNVYAISTFGGIIFTLVFGFVVVPAYGISMPLRILGVAVIATGALFAFLTQQKGWRTKATAVTIVAFMLAMQQQRSHGSTTQAVNLQIQERSEGLLGELSVTDELTQTPDGKQVVLRKLKINNVQQNFVFRDMPSQSLNYYVNFLRQVVGLLPKKQSALLIGLGGGSIYNVLHKMNMQVETVEIDERIYKTGTRYFGMPEHNTNITDGRYHLNVTRKKYDLIFIDAIIGENVPIQLLSVESFMRCRELLNSGGTLVIEQGGLSDFSHNSFVPSVVKTLQEAGFFVTAFNPLRKEDLGDVVLLASTDARQYGDLSIQDDVFIPAGQLKEYFLPMSQFKEKDALVLTDEMNGADRLLRDHYMSIRKGVRQHLAKAPAFAKR